jgi:hypothetical protein
MNTIGKKNILFGFAYFLATLGMGMYLANKHGSASEEWLQSVGHELMKQAHVHGNLESLLNIVCGTLICFYGTSSGKLAKIASVLFIVAALLHSGAFYLGGLGIMAALKVAPLGAISLVAAMAMMIAIISKGLTLKE